MTPEMVIDIGHRALQLTLMLAAPMLVISLVVGVLISIVQATTQINEMTLTFVPKIFAVFVATALFMPWMISTFLRFVEDLFIMIPGLTS